MPNILVRVAAVVEETPDIRALRLVRDDGRPFEPYQAGAHIDVTGPTGIVRQYSLCGPPDDPTALLIAVKREAESRGGSAALHTVAEGDELRVGAPRNLLTLAADADRHVLVAGESGSPRCWVWPTDCTGTRRTSNSTTSPAAAPTRPSPNCSNDVWTSEIAYTCTSGFPATISRPSWPGSPPT